jgi:hypothetical protein
VENFEADQSCLDLKKSRDSKALEKGEKPDTFCENSINGPSH